MKQFRKYSKFYDFIYKDKNYRKEVEFVCKFINKYEPHTKNILSLGCGTCNHEILLAKKGFKIVGIDASAEMLRIAEKKIKEAGLGKDIKIFNRNTQSFRFKKRFGVAIALFNIVGYLADDAQLESTLSNIYKSLTKNGVFMFDCWYLPAVLKDRPTDRIKEVNVGNRRIVRFTKSHIDTANNIIDINFKTLEMDGNNLLSESDDTHKMRYWSFLELKHFLTKAGFSIEFSCNFMDEKSPISENNWNIFIVARKSV